MALPNDPSVTYNAHGNALTSQSLAGGASVTFTADFSAALGGWLQVADTGGASVATTNGLQVQVYPAGDATPRYDTVAAWSYTIPTVASTLAAQSINLPTGKYQIKLTNVDATNAVTVEGTTNPVT